MKGSNILQRTGIIGSNPIVAVLDVGCSPSGVRFDLTVTSVKEFTVEANNADLMNPIQADGIEG